MSDSGELSPFDFNALSFNSTLEIDLGDFSWESDLNVERPQSDLSMKPPPPPKSDLKVETLPPPLFSDDFDVYDLDIDYEEVLSDEPMVVDIYLDSDDGEGFHMDINFDDDFEISDLLKLDEEEEEEDDDEQLSQYENLSMSIDSVDEFLLSALEYEEEGDDSNTQTTRTTPTAKLAAENLPCVNLSKEDMVVCTICRDEIEEGEVANKLPCSHCYHRDCIVSWLDMRNTCPVCRFELPADDLS